MSIVSPKPERNPESRPCTTLGCPEPATLVGTFIDHDVTFEDVAYCTFCAGYLYQQFEPTGPVRGVR